MSIKKYTESLEQYYNREDLLRETLKQIKKDLGSLYSYQQDWQEESYSFQTLLSFLTPLFDELLKSYPHELVQAFYRMDLSELEVGNAVSINDIDERAREVAILVIRRELKKVIIRKYYSDQL